VFDIHLFVEGSPSDARRRRPCLCRDAPYPGARAFRFFHDLARVLRQLSPDSLFAVGLKRRLFAVIVNCVCARVLSTTPISAIRDEAGGWQIILLHSGDGDKTSSAILLDTQTGNTWMLVVPTNDALAWAPIERKKSMGAQLSESQRTTAAN